MVVEECTEEFKIDVYGEKRVGIRNYKRNRILIKCTYGKASQIVDIYVKEKLDMY